MVWLDPREPVGLGILWDVLRVWVPLPLVLWLFPTPLSWDCFLPDSCLWKWGQCGGSGVLCSGGAGSSTPLRYQKVLAT